MKNKAIYFILILIVVLLMTLFFVINRSSNISKLLALKPTAILELNRPNYIINKTSNYSVTQPNWTPMSKSVVDEDIITTAVSNDKCSYFMIDTPVNMSDDAIKEYLNQIFSNKISQYFVTVDKKNIQDNQIQVEGTFKSLSGEFYAATQGYFSPDRKKLYFMIFAGEKQNFEANCRTYIKSTFESFKLQK